MPFSLFSDQLSTITHYPSSWLTSLLPLVVHTFSANQLQWYILCFVTPFHRMYGLSGFSLDITFNTLAPIRGSFLWHLVIIYVLSCQNTCPDDSTNMISFSKVDIPKYFVSYLQVYMPALIVYARFIVVINARVDLLQTCDMIIDHVDCSSSIPPLFDYYTPGVDIYVRFVRFETLSLRRILHPI